MPPEDLGPAIQDSYVDDYAWCYGCGRLNPGGYHFQTRWDGSETLTLFTPRAEHTAIPGFVYGGLIASLIDCHSTGSAGLALYRRDGHEPGDAAAPPRCLTASLHVDYHRPTPLGPTLTVRGIIAEMGQRKVVVKSTLLVNGVVCVSAEVVAVAAKAEILHHR